MCLGYVMLRANPSSNYRDCFRSMGLTWVANARFHHPKGYSGRTNRTRRRRRAALLTSDAEHKPQTTFVRNRTKLGD